MKCCQKIQLKNPNFPIKNECYEFMINMVRVMHLPMFLSLSSQKLYKNLNVVKYKCCYSDNNEVVTSIFIKENRFNYYLLLCCLDYDKRITLIAIMLTYCYIVVQYKIVLFLRRKKMITMALSRQFSDWVFLKAFNESSIL